MLLYAAAIPATAITLREIIIPAAVWHCFSQCSIISALKEERTRVEWVSAAEGAKFAATMNEFAETVAALGENKRLEDLRCKK